MSAYRHNWGQRLGFCPYKLEKCIWVHAVSLGESIAATPLIQALQKKYPSIPIVVTNMTPTGAARIRSVFGESIFQCYVPYDIPHMIKRFLRSVNPMIAIIVETELWPNLLNVTHQQKIPIIVVNARLSEKSFRSYQWVATLTKEILQNIDVIAIQTQPELERFKALGLDPARALVTGNIKFDIEVSADLFLQSDALRRELGKQRLIWIAASTHAGEEEIILAAHKQICQRYPGTLLILVPRHPDRFPAVYHLTKQLGFQVARRSQFEECSASTQIYFGDTTGELMLLYAASDVAFVGGSFIPVGGHNVLEAAVLGKPIITGSYLFNFSEITQLLTAKQGMKQVNNESELVDELSHFFSNPSHRLQVGASARAFVEEHRGGLTRQVNAITKIIDNRCIMK